MKRLRTLALVVLGLVGLGAAAYAVFHFSPQQRHARQLHRLSDHVRPALEPLRRLQGQPPLSYDDYARAEILKAIDTAAWNELYRHERCDPAKLAALVRELAATEGRRFRTVQGCLGVMADMEDVCPTVRDYIWFQQIRELQVAGIIPRRSATP